MSDQVPKSTRDLRPTERRFLTAMQELGHGRFESLRIHDGELVLEPWPTTVQSVKFGNPTPNSRCAPAEFALKQEMAQFFMHVRGVDTGMIRMLEVRGGLPFCMDLVK